MPINPNPVVWFEIPASDIERAQKFYEKAFEVKLTPNEMGLSKMAWFPMEMGSAGAAGTLVQGEGFTPSMTGSLVYIQVSGIDAALAKVGAAGENPFCPA